MSSRHRFHLVSHESKHGRGAEETISSAFIVLGVLLHAHTHTPCVTVTCYVPYQPSKQFTAAGCAAALLHRERHLVDELLQPVQTLQGLTGHLTEKRDTP